MLALARKSNESIMLGNDIEITVLEIKGDQVIVPKGFYFFDSCFLWKFC